MAKQISDLKLGILGGGQLGRMLIQQGLNYNLTTHVLEPDQNAPCKDIASKFEVGSITDYNTVYNFGRQVDIITIEIEKVNTEALEALERDGKLVYPQPRVINLIKDKGVQKQFFIENDIPTAPFKLVNGLQDIETCGFSFPYILKQRKDGYDGHGVMKISSRKDIANAFEAPSLVEEMIDFKKEVAVIVARNADGEMSAFPMVDMEFNKEANLVEFLVSPSEFSLEIQEEGKRIAMEIAGLIKITGILAVEMFVTQDNKLLVNELAPRPHNSGHQTIEGNYTSQYEQHLRAIFNLPLGDTSLRGTAVMLNLLGEKDHNGVAVYEGLDKILEQSGVNVHLYGKKFTKPFRKMGHITIVDPERERAIEKANFVKDIFKVKS